jgi:DNA-binding NarL/FixJ family response regulator
MAKSVLIAESNKVFSEAMAGALSLLGFVVVGTTSKRSVANALALETKPDLLIFDCHLSGDETVGFSDMQYLKDHSSNMKIIALGCHDKSDEIMEMLVKDGFDGYWNRYDNLDGLLKQLNILLP